MKEVELRLSTFKKIVFYEECGWREVRIVETHGSSEINEETIWRSLDQF